MIVGRFLAFASLVWGVGGCTEPAASSSSPPPPGASTSEPAPNRPPPTSVDGARDAGARPKLSWAGYYVPQAPLTTIAGSYFPQTYGASNLVTFLYQPGWAGQTAANILAANAQSVVLYIDIANFQNDDRYVMNRTLDPARGPERDWLLATIKKEISVDSRFIEHVKFVSPGEEMYARAAAGAFDGWQVFAGKTRAEIVQMMRGLLEENTLALKAAFPGIPTLHVENRYDENWPPPPSLDVLGVDAYPIYSGPECDPTQRAVFDAQAAAVIAKAATFGKPIMSVPGTFEANPWRMPSACQLAWYHDLVRTEPSVIGVQWFTWATAGGLSGLSAPAFATQLSATIAFGREVVGAQPR